MENLRITPSIQRNLLSSTKWFNFFAILGAIGVALMFMGGVGCILAGVLNLGNTFDSAGLIGLGFIYIVLGGVYIYPLNKSFALISNTKNAMYNASQPSLEQSAENLKSILQ